MIAADRAFFKAYPDRQHLLRKALPGEAGPVLVVRRDGETRAVPGPLIFNGELDAAEAFKAGHS